MHIVDYRKVLKNLLSLDDSPHKIALSFALGVYISISPFLGLHTILAIVLSFVFRLNKVATITGSWMNNPWTLAPVYYADFKLGSFILNGDATFNIRPFTLEHYLNSGKGVFLDIFVGSVFVGLVASTLSYFALKFALEKGKKHVSYKG